MGKIFPKYMGKVNVPCKRCHNLVRLELDEKINYCPYCHSKWT